MIPVWSPDDEVGDPVHQIEWDSAGTGVTGVAGTTAAVVRSENAARGALGQIEGLAFASASPLTLFSDSLAHSGFASDLSHSSSMSDPNATTGVNTMVDTLDSDELAVKGDILRDKPTSCLPGVTPSCCNQFE